MVPLGLVFLNDDGCLDTPSDMQLKGPMIARWQRKEEASEPW